MISGEEKRALVFVGTGMLMDCDGKNQEKT